MICMLKPPRSQWICPLFKLFCEKSMAKKKVEEKEEFLAGQEGKYRIIIKWVGFLMYIL